MVSMPPSACLPAADERYNFEEIAILQNDVVIGSERNDHFITFDRDVFSAEFEFLEQLGERYIVGDGFLFAVDVHFHNGYFTMSAWKVQGFIEPTAGRNHHLAIGGRRGLEGQCGGSVAAARFH